MNSFSDAWLVQHQAKMAAMRAEPVAVAAPASELVEFVLPHATLLLNTLLRMHWTVRRKYQKSLAGEIAALTRDAAGHQPFDRASILVTRYCLQLADPDNLPSSAKCILDSIVVRSTRNPDGIGLIQNDTAAHITLEVRQVKVSKQAEQRTTVRIERLA
jgi:hypothetical protein